MQVEQGSEVWEGAHLFRGRGHTVLLKVGRPPGVLGRQTLSLIFLHAIYFNFIFQLQFVFKIILYLFQVYSVVVRQSCTYLTKCSAHYFQCQPGPTRSYHSMTDCIPYPALHISATVW